MNTDMGNYIQEIEFEILITLDWNLSDLAGYDIITLLLKFSNEFDNFDSLKDMISKYGLILLRETKISYLVKDSTLFMGAIKDVCNQ